MAGESFTQSFIVDQDVIVTAKFKRVDQPPNEPCRYETVQVNCSDVLGPRYTGQAIQTINVGPSGCIENPEVILSVNTNFCTRIDEPPICETQIEEIACSTLLINENYIGNARRIKLRTDSNGQNVPTNCLPDPNINYDWDTAKCSYVIDVTNPPVAQFRICDDTNPNNFATDVPLGYGVTSDIYGPCWDRVWRSCVDPETNIRGTPPVNYELRNGLCWAPIKLPPVTTPTVTVTQAIPTVTPTPTPNITPTVVVEGNCIPPIGGFNRTREIACTTLGSQYVGGIAIQQQVRSYDASGPAGTVCGYTEWMDSGTPDTAQCQLRNVPITCTPPTGPTTRTIGIPCSQIDAKYTSGTAIQQQVRRYDSSASGPGTCPFTWENSGVPDVSTCKIPVYWRNCITGDLVEGTPPIEYIQSNFQSGGVCWEPVPGLGFSPSLSEALRFTYQRGSSRFPETKTINVTNSSYGITFRVTVTTNNSITLSTNRNQSSQGTLSFVVEPRSEVKLMVTITPELLQQLQDGMSTLSMTVDYDRVIE